MDSPRQVMETSEQAAASGQANHQQADHIMPQQTQIQQTDQTNQNQMQPMQQVYQVQDALHRITTLLSTYGSNGNGETMVDTMLNELSVLMQGPQSVDVVYAFRPADVAILGYYAFEYSHRDRRCLALQCLCAAMSKDPQVSRMFVSHGLALKAIELLRVRCPFQGHYPGGGVPVAQSDNDLVEQYLAESALALCATCPDSGFPPNLEYGNLAAVLNMVSFQHWRALVGEPGVACVRHLHLISVLAARNQATSLLPSMEPIIHMFHRTQVQKPALEPPVLLMIDCLNGLASQDGVLTGRPFPPFNVDKLVAVLVLAFLRNQPGELEINITPLISLLYKISRWAPEATKQRLRELLLPSDHDRRRGLGTNDTLPNWLWKLCLGAISSTLERILAHLFLELSDGDPAKLIQNLDRASAVSLLHSIGMQAPVDPSYAGIITGGYWDFDPFTGLPRGMEPQLSNAEMTEAERLSVLMGDVANARDAAWGTDWVGQLDFLTGSNSDRDMSSDLDGGPSIG